MIESLERVIQNIADRKGLAQSVSLSRLSDERVAYALVLILNIVCLVEYKAYHGKTPSALMASLEARNTTVASLLLTLRALSEEITEDKLLLAFQLEGLQNVSDDDILIRVHRLLGDQSKLMMFDERTVEELNGLLARIVHFTDVSVAFDSPQPSQMNHVNSVSGRDMLLDVMDRMAMGRLDDQRAEVRSKEILRERIIAATAIAELVFRLSQGRIESQRSSGADLDRYTSLDSVVNSVYYSVRSRMSEQRLSLSTAKEREIDIGPIFSIINRMLKSDLNNQRALSYEERVAEYRRVIEEAVDKASTLKYADQTYELSHEHEKFLGLSHLYTKIERIASTELSDQVAMTRTQIKEQNVAPIISTVEAMLSKSLEDQRFRLSEALERQFDLQPLQTRMLRLASDRMAEQDADPYGSSFQKFSSLNQLIDCMGRMERGRMRNQEFSRRATVPTGMMGSV